MPYEPLPASVLFGPFFGLGFRVHQVAKNSSGAMTDEAASPHEVP